MITETIGLKKKIYRISYYFPYNSVRIIIGKVFTGFIVVFYYFGIYYIVNVLISEIIICMEMEIDYNWWEKYGANRINDFKSWVGDYNTDVKTECRKHVINKKYESILDCGAGLCSEYNGYINDSYNIKYSAIDRCSYFVELGKKQGIDIQLADIESIPFNDESFDVVFAKEVLEHLPYYNKALKEMIRVAKKEVVIVWFLPPDNQVDIIRYDEKECLYHNTYNIDGILSIIGNHNISKHNIEKNEIWFITKEKNF